MDEYGVDEDTHQPRTPPSRNVHFLWDKGLGEIDALCGRRQATRAMETGLLERFCHGRKDPMK